MLTAREVRVVAGIAAGLTYEEIGARLFYSRWTVAKDAARIKRELRVGSKRAIPAAYQRATGRSPYAPS